MAQAQTLRDEKAARAIDREVSPLWHDRFARVLWRHLPPPGPGLALDVNCGVGRTTTQMLERLDPSTRVVAIEPDPTLRELAKAKLAGTWKDRLWLKAGSLDDVGDMAERSYDLVVANLVLGEVSDLGEAVRELVRVIKPGGRLLATLPMDGSWVEVEDIFREVLREAGLEDAVRRLRRLSHVRPGGQDLARIAGEAGVAPHNLLVEQERFELLFSSGREFLFTPLVEYGPLRLWKAIIGPSGTPQELFWKLKEAIDAYTSGRAFNVTIVAGLLHVVVPTSPTDTPFSDYWRRYPDLDALWRAREAGAGTTRVRSAAHAEVDVDIDIELDDESSTDEAALGAAAEALAPSPEVSMSDEDAAIFALLEQPLSDRPAEDLDALLDQVLEFAGPKDEIQEIPDEELEEVPAEPLRKPGDTLQRIKALLPPPPTVTTTAPQLVVPIMRPPKDD